MVIERNGKSRLNILFYMQNLDLQAHVVTCMCRSN
jgi:hypothetical protein